MPNLPYRTYIAYYLGRRSDNKKARFFDRLICFFTRSKYSHVEVVYSLDLESGYGCSATSSCVDGGVRQAYINFKSGSWEVFEVATSKTTIDIIQWFNEHKGQAYDWFGALGAYVTPINGESRRYFCVEAVGESLGIPGANKMTPEEFFRYYQLLGHRQVI